MDGNAGDDWGPAQQERLAEALRTGDQGAARELLRARICVSLAEQGFGLGDGGLVASGEPGKDGLRKMHAAAVARQVMKARPGLARHEDRLVRRLAAGPDVDPERMSVAVTPVLPDTEDELLFRWARLHWSVPTSAGYGRRLRFLVTDQHNGALVGVIGLGDPVFALRPRDEWVGWDRERRREALRHVLDAFVVGAVPPYSHLLAGKLVAALLACQEITAAFDVKYGDRSSVVAGRSGARLALVTTASALGRSSVYNRVALDGRTVLHRVGETLGSGDFPFAAELYDDVNCYARSFCTPTAKHAAWGTGFRNRREVVRRVLRDLELPDRMIYHGVKRELYACPTGPASREFLRGDATAPGTWGRSAAEIGWAAQQRWILRRAAAGAAWEHFDPQSWRLWHRQA